MVAFHPYLWASPLPQFLYPLCWFESPFAHASVSLSHLDSQAKKKHSQATGPDAALGTMWL